LVAPTFDAVHPVIELVDVEQVMFDGFVQALAKSILDLTHGEFLRMKQLFDESVALQENKIIAKSPSISV